MSQSRRKIVQYLNEAHAAEVGLTRTLQAQVAATPSGSFRNLLNKHLGETKRHAERLQSRIQEIDGGAGFRPLSFGIGMAETVFSQALAIGKTPIELIRGTGGEEKVLKNAKDDCAAEALEIATYTALERLADADGDDETAQLAASIRAEEEHMLERLLAAIPRLTDAVAESDSYGAVSAVKQTVAKEARRTAREARRIPGVAEVEGEVRGVFADADDLPITGYDELTAAEIAEQLPRLSQVELGMVDAYERSHQGRTTVLSRIDALRGNEPWSGYDDQTVDEIEKKLAGVRDTAKLKAVRDYEQAHKGRTTVARATERELAGRS